jgi:GGDEF domain-containing protein
VETATSTKNALKRVMLIQLRHATTINWQKVRNLTHLTTGDAAMQEVIRRRRSQIQKKTTTGRVFSSTHHHA